MAEEISRAIPPAATEELDPGEYAAFIGQIELDATWLDAARIVNHRGPKPPEQASVALGESARWEQRPDGFHAFQSYEARIEADNTLLAEIDVTFGLHFKSARPMTDRIFAVFQEVNLPVNTWPYLREFLAGTTGRMNWITFTLPTLKRGTQPGTQSAKGRRKAQALRAKPARRGRDMPKEG